MKQRPQAIRTSDGGCREAAFPNLARHFVPRSPNQLWVGDITYIRTRLAFVFLAVILDAWSRRVVGFAVSRQIDTRLTIAALRAALENRRPPPGCIHHTDRGTQYASAAYRALMAEWGLRGSMSRRWATRPRCPRAVHAARRARAGPKDSSRTPQDSV